MVELELSLANLATVSDGQEREQFAKDVGDRAADAVGSLEEIAEALTEDRLSVPPEIVSILEAVDGVKLKRRLDRTALSETAQRVGNAARRFAARHDGSGLDVVDDFLPSKPRGSVYLP